MTFNSAIAQIRTGHLMVRDTGEWDELALALSKAYHGKDDELIEQLLPPFVQSWRTVTTLVLRDTLRNGRHHGDGSATPMGNRNSDGERKQL